MPQPAAPTTPAPPAPAPAPATFRRIAWRLVPFMMLLYFVAFLDRANVGFASLHMNPDLGIDKPLFGFGSGAFFLGYFLFEVPSNLLLDRVGARRWISRIMISWGLVSAAMALVVGPVSYVSLRVLLGVAEAGFFPGMILYLTYWFPAARRARVIALFVAAIPISSAIGAPLSTTIMSGLNGVAGLRGWQWLFLLEGLPAVLLGAVVPFCLTDRPANARWLAPQERDALQHALDAENQPKPHLPLRRALLHPAILTLSAIYFCMMVGLYGLTFWLPQVLKQQGLTDAQIGWTAVIPYAIGALVMLPFGRHSDHTGEREGHVGLALGVAALGFVLASLAREVTLVTAGFTLVSVGVFCAMPTFWPLPTARLRGTAAAGGVAVVNSIGNLGGFLGPSLIGALSKTRLGLPGGLLALALLLTAGAGVVLATKGRTPAPGAVG